MSWGDVGKSNSGSGGAGRFVAFEDGVSVRLRILDEEPHTTRVHKISQPVKKGDKTEDTFRTIPATDSADESYILRMNGKRYPEQQQFNMRSFEYKRVDGKHVSDGEVKILQGGNAIFKTLHGLFKEHGSLSKFDILITRTGKGRDTQYTVTAAPFPLQNPIDVDAAIAKMHGDETLAWENVFPKTSGADQERLVKEAGFDIAYDPAAAIAASMSYEQAMEVKLTFGKYKDKSIREMMVIDAGYIDWAAANVNTNDMVAAACRVAIGKAATISAAQEPVRQQLPSAPAPAAPAPAKENNADKATLVEKINDYFTQDPRFEDISSVVETVKKHGNGKTKVRDLTIPQLNALLNEIQNG